MTKSNRSIEDVIASNVTPDATPATHHPQLDSASKAPREQTGPNSASDGQADAMGTAQHVAADLSAPLTRARIMAGIVDGMTAIFSGLAEMEQVTVGTNGKLYPITQELPRDVDDTGSIEIRNRYRYVSDPLLNGVCWKLDSMLEYVSASIAKEGDKLARMRRLKDGTTLSGQQYQQSEGFLHQLEEQRDILGVAFGAACHTFDVLTGAEYETQAQRRVRIAAEERLKAATPAVPRVNRFA